MLKILFLAANPTDTERLRLDEEARAIDEAMQRAKFRDRFELLTHWAVRIGDLQELLLRHQPHIVHFSGHGSEENAIILQDAAGNGVTVPPTALSNLFRVLKDDIRCVLLNACYSEAQAEGIAQHIDGVIGMPDAVTDGAALAFATAFYRGLGYGRTLQTAFELGCSELDLHGLDESHTPQLLGCADPAEVILVDPQALAEEAADERRASLQVNTGGGAYIGGSVNAGGEFVGRDKIVHGDDVRGDKVTGDKFTGDKVTTGNLSNNTGVAIGPHASAHVTQNSGVSGEELAPLFAPLYSAVRSAAPAEQQTAAVQQVEHLQAEAQKGEQADDSRLATLIEGLVGLVPSAVSTVVSTFANPILGGLTGPVTTYVLSKLKRDSSGGA